MSHRQPTPPPRTLVDTGERARIVDEAVAESVEKVREEFVTNAECRENAREVVRDFHDNSCPAAEMRSAVRSVEGAIGGIQVQFAGFQGVFTAKMDDIQKQVDKLFTRTVAVLGLLFTIIAGVWALSRETQPQHKHAIESRDAGISAGTAVAFTTQP